MARELLWAALDEGGQLNVRDIIERLTDEDKTISVNHRYDGGRTSLHKAASSGSLDVAKLLVKNGAMVNFKDGEGSTALHKAASSCSLEVVQYLVEKGAEINAKNDHQGTALHWAARNRENRRGSLDVVRYLVEKDAEVNCKDEEGRTALMLAVCSSSLEVVQYLVENGAEINGKNGYGSTALHYAASTSSLEIVRYLVKKGAEINCKDNWEDTALHKACYSGDNSIVDFLLKKGARKCINDIRIGHFNHTPLTAACSKGHSSIVRTLKNFGANIGKPDGNNKTPLEWSIECGNSGIASILKKESKKQASLQKLSQMPPEKITKVGPAKVCFEDEFGIGKGCEGTCVYIGLLDDGSEVAVKRMVSYSCKSLAENEKKILSLLEVEESQHIVNYRYFQRGDPFSYLVLDLCEETLEDYVKSHSKEHLEQHGPIMIREILTGLKALHCGKQKILHMDIKPTNILVDRNGHLRLADFGLSRVLNEDETTLETGAKGTRGWMAVESNSFKKGEKATFKRKSDIQVVGMISFYILTKGGHPFGPEQFRIGNLIEGKSDLEQLTNSQVRKFVSWLINHNINDRPYVEEALAHPYLQ